MAAPRSSPHDPSPCPRGALGNQLRCALAAALAGLVLAPAACSHDWDAYDPRLGGGGQATSSTGGTTSSTGGTGGTLTGGTGGTVTGGTGGTGGSGGCEPNTATDCYSGPAGTAGVGTCKSGSAVCNPEGTGYGPCLGEITPAVEDCKLADDEDCNGLPNDHCGLWAKRFGASSEQRPQALAVDASGNVVVAGRMVGSMAFGSTVLASGGGLDVFVAKLSPDGDPVWARSFGDAAEQQAFGVAVDAAGNVLLTGVFAGTIDFGGGAGSVHTSAGLVDAFVVKLSGSTGNHVWSRAAGGTLDQAGLAVATDDQGNVFVGGPFAGATDFGLGATSTSVAALDAFVWKLSSAGVPQWVKTFGEAGDDETLAVATNAAGHVFATGYFDEEVDFGSGVINDGGSTDVFVVEIDALGNYVFGEGFPAVGNQRATGISLDAAGNLFLTGNADVEVSFGGAPVPIEGLEDNVFAVKLDPDGSALWLKVFGDTAHQDTLGSAVDSLGDLVLIGSNEGVIDFGGGALINPDAVSSNVFVAKLDGAAGDHVWSRHFGDAGDQDGRAIAADPANDILVTGELVSTIDFGTGTLQSAGSDDVFVAKLPP